ncbi:MAG: hypothetical protein C0597_00930, partial [Marinilabiliales bacterium]
IISEPITILEPTEVLIDTLVTHLLCNGDSDGSIDVTVTGGTSPYTYAWTTSDGSGLVPDAEDQSDLRAGKYDLTVTDDNSCTATTSITILEPTAINIAETEVNDISCNGLSDGSIDITVSGGTVATVYTYNWSTSDGSGEVPGDEDQTGLGAGTYDLTVTDDNLCTENISIAISEPPAISIDSENSTPVSPSSGIDGTLTVTASGGTGVLSYTLNEDDITNITGVFTELDTGDYTVKVTDENGCEITSNIITLDFNVGVINISNSDKIKLYPNPTSDRLFIEIDFDYEDLKMEIISISGQLILNKEIESHGNSKEEVDLSEYPKGIYFIRIYNGDFDYKAKILLQ